MSSSFIRVRSICICVSLPTQIAVNNAHSSLMQGLLFQQMVLDHSPLAFKLIVERDNLVQDTLNHLVSTEPYNYKKPLQVHTCMYRYMYTLSPSLFLPPPPPSLSLSLPPPPSPSLFLSLPLPLHSSLPTPLPSSLPSTPGGICW